MDSNWLEYLEALSKCCQATWHAAEYAEKCNAYAKNAERNTKLTSFFIREALTDLKEIKAGIKVGLILIDTAESYQNEDINVGEKGLGQNFIDY